MTAEITEFVGHLVGLVATEEVSERLALAAIKAAGGNADAEWLTYAVEALRERDTYLSGWKDADCPPHASQHAANAIAADQWDAELTDAVRRLATPAREAVA